MSIETMKQALAALEWHTRGATYTPLRSQSAITALRQAITEAEQAQPVRFEQELINLLCRIHRDGGHYVLEHGLRTAIDDADIRVAKLNALSDTFPPYQPEQAQPVAYEIGDELWWHSSPDINDYIRKNGIPLYRHPPYRQPLTDEQINDLVMQHLGPHALTDGKMSVYDAFLLGIRATEAAHNVKEEA